MSWENQGEWHIDHHRPCASFDFKTDREKKLDMCFHYTNLQPLWGGENRSKGADFDEVAHPLKWSMKDRRWMPK